MIDLDYTTVTPDEFAYEFDEPTCSECEWYRGCPFEGAEHIGYCTDIGEFVHADDEDCHEEEE